MSAETIVECRDVSFGYDSDEGGQQILRGVDMDIAKGTLTAITGPSGSGKSTLLRLLACLDRADSGTVEIAGRDTTAMSARQRRALRRRDVGFVRQNPSDNLIDHLTVRQHFALAASMGRRAGDRAAITGLLDRLGMAGKANRRPRQLSGGEQQRVSIGFAWLGRSSLLLLDEPTGQLDHMIGDELMATLDELRGDGLAIVLATHDLEVAEQTDQILRLRDGKVVR